MYAVPPYQVAGECNSYNRETSGEDQAEVVKFYAPPGFGTVDCLRFSESVRACDGARAGGTYSTDALRCCYTLPVPS